MSAIPKEDGFYWAMWLVSDDDTPKFHDYTPSHVWEVVELYTNDDGERRAYIGGVPGSQGADGFHWHDEKLSPPAHKIRERAEQREDEAFRLYRNMTPEQRAEHLAAEDKRRREADAAQAKFDASI